MIGRWLARVGGAQDDLLDKAPGDRIKFSTLGGVLIGTAALAGISAAFALQTTVKVGAVGAVAVGLLWALLILTLDRQLVVTMSRQNGLAKNLLSSVPRVILAVLLGAVISMPLVLRIFQPEIDTELGRQRDAAIKAISDEVGANPRFSQIDALRTQVADATNVEKNPEIIRIQQQLAAERKRSAELNEEIGCEVSATAGCQERTLGKGPRYEENTRQFGISQAAILSLEAQLKTETDAFNQRVAAELQNQNTALGRDNAELNAVVAARDALVRDRTAAAEQNTGLSARLQALSDLGARFPMVAWAHWTLFALFAAIEILPVLAKLLSLSGPPTLYERLAARREETTADTDYDAAAQDREVATVDADLKVQLARERAEAQLEAGRETNALLVARQKAIANTAIERWSDAEQRRTEREMARQFPRDGRPPASSWSDPTASEWSGDPVAEQWTAEPGQHTTYRFSPADDSRDRSAADADRQPWRTDPDPMPYPDAYPADEWSRDRI